VEFKCRVSHRLSGYDYSSSALYFVTICIQDRVKIFGSIHDGKMLLNDAGKMIDKTIKSMENKFPVLIDSCQIMPDHIHMILNVGATLVVAYNDKTNNTNEICRAGTRPAPTVGNIVGVFKSLSTNEYIYHVKHDHWTMFNRTLWQRNYYDHIIRNEKEYWMIRQYIVNNPLHWNDDELFM
jgi:REP element-mobilizing transposase RayT